MNTAAVWLIRDPCCQLVWLREATRHVHHQVHRGWPDYLDTDPESITGSGLRVGTDDDLARALSRLCADGWHVQRLHLEPLLDPGSDAEGDAGGDPDDCAYDQVRIDLATSDTCRACDLTLTWLGHPPPPGT